MAGGPGPSDFFQPTLRVPLVPRLFGTGDGSATLPKPASVGVFSQCMKGERIRYQQTGEFHFLTFSCFRRHTYLSSGAAMELFEDAGRVPAFG